MCFNLCDLFAEPNPSRPRPKSTPPVESVVPTVKSETDALIGKFIIVPPNLTPSIYRIDKLLGSGGFGVIFLGSNVRNQVQVAIKLEKKDSPQRQLYLEYGFYLRLGKQCTYAPEIFAMGHLNNWYALVMQLLGPNLLKMTEIVGGTLSVTCTSAVAISLLEIFRSFHEKGLIFRDVKPENFLLGLPGTLAAHLIYIIDLGLCKDWRDKDGKHIPNTAGGVLTGTPVYMSTNCHKGHQLSRRDDLESLMYMLVDLRTRSLPWTNLDGEENMGWEESANLIGQIKEKTTADILCSKMGTTFTQVYTQCRKLGFEEKPDYKLYIELFMATLKKFNIDAGTFIRAFDWNASHQKRPNQKLRNCSVRKRLVNNPTSKQVNQSKASPPKTRSLGKKPKETKPKMPKVSMRKKK